MAFDSVNLTVSRGRFNCHTGCLKPAVHTYYSNDSMGLITSQDYFPPYFGLGSDSYIKVGDSLQINSFNIEEVSFIYIISSVSPVTLVLLDQLEYNTYTASYSWAAVGTLNFALSRNPSGIVTFKLLSTLQFVTGPSEGRLIIDFTFPEEYTPSRSFYDDETGFVGVTQSVLIDPPPERQFATNIQIAPYASTPIFHFSRMPLANWRVGWTIITRNFSLQYYGNPLT